MPARYSRHYYDLYCYEKSQYKESAFRQLDLLERVVAFKKKFYRCPWAKYEEAKPGTMRLVPAECHRAELKLDYESMKNMIYFYRRVSYNSVDAVVNKSHVKIFFWTKNTVPVSSCCMAHHMRSHVFSNLFAVDCHVKIYVAV